jgi:aldose 1-epimerase
MDAMIAMRTSLFATVVLCFALAVPAAAQPYAARRTGDIVQLEDAKSQTSVSIITSMGNIAYEMNVNGRNILRFPFASIDEYRARPSRQAGIPLLAPWANRLSEQAFSANGKRYALDMQLGNVTGATPLHGVLFFADKWEVVEAKSDAVSAWVTSRLDFYKYPQWMQQFPFAHTIEVTHRLQNGALEVRMTVTNMSAEPMPMSMGFHPYFTLHDAPRDEWTITTPAKTNWLLSDLKIPTGATQPVAAFFNNGPALGPYNIDDVFSDLTRDASGLATTTIKGKNERIDVVQGPNYRASVIYSPKTAQTTANFIAVEPMAGITDAMNLAQKGIYKELQSIPAGGIWTETFWIKPSGF